MAGPFDDAVYTPEDPSEGKKGLSDKTKSKLKAAGAGLSQYADKAQEGATKLADQDAGVKSFRKGGRVRKTGLIHAHRGEEVVRPEEAGKVRKFLKKHKGRGGEDREAEGKPEDKREDLKKTARKGSPARFGRKEAADRTIKKHSPKRKLGRGKGKRMKGQREM